MRESAISSTQSDPLPIPTGTKDRLEQALQRLPFRSHLSLEPLFEELARLGKAAPDVPALRGAITDPAVLDEHKDVLRELLGHVFPALLDDQLLVRAYAPFAPGSFFTTPSYREVFGAEGVEISQANGMVRREFFNENLLFAYRILFHRNHEQLASPRAFVKQVRDTHTGLDRFFMNEGSIQFARVDHGDLELLPKAEFQRLLDMEDLDELQRRMPLDGVTFSGFIYIRYVEITELHNLSLLKSELVQEGALKHPDRIRDRLRSILGLADVDLGVVLRYEASGDGRFCNNRSLLRGYEGCMAKAAGSLYDRVGRTGTPVFIPDLAEHDGSSPLVGLLREDGFRSLALIPLVEDHEVIGVLEIGSRTPEAVNPTVSRKLCDLMGPITVAARREMDETASAIERTIKAHCTAIHPSVAWRFEEAAYHYNAEVAAKGSAAFEAIAFDGVYPLFGAMDIRGSSASRNVAIEADLLEQLGLARGTLAVVRELLPMPILDYYDAALARFESSVRGGLSSGDEIAVIEFLHSRIEPFLEDVRRRDVLPKDASGFDAIDRYCGKLDPSLGILYRQRKHYEHSVALINERLAKVTERAQEQAQAIFPHYFEMFRTDGVEHSIYVGQSMTRDGTFSDVQLKNLRLWQLELMCEQARVAEGLLAEMDVPLRTTPLVLVQSSPITIQFSTDEKQFAVEGSYNIRYEIIKKRIDKATVRGTGERLTQPGRLAVIYTQDREQEEYRRYFDYLAEKGCLAGDVELLELDDLQGVSGLRALRAEIVLPGAPA